MTELRDFYAALVESSDDAIVAKNTDGIVISWNPAAERLFGYTAKDMNGSSLAQTVQPKCRAEEAAINERISPGIC